MFLWLFVDQDVTPLQIVYPDTALRLQALLDFEEDGGEKRVAGDEWLFEGPGRKEKASEQLQNKLNHQITV